MDKEKPEGWAHDRISRRKALKRVGAGAALVWSAPIISSLGTPAFAQYPTCPEPCSACFDSTAAPCGVDPVRGGTCGCSRTIEGDCACSANDFCNEWGNCADSGDCPAGFVCKPVGCTGCSTDPAAMNCSRPCGAPLPNGAPARAARGRRMSG